MQCRYLVNIEQKTPIIDSEVVVVGSGIAGLYTAKKLAEQGAKVTLISKKSLRESNTYYAQGGIAAAISSDDSPELHCQDTIYAGAGLCNVAAVSQLTSEGPDRINDLLNYGASFDKNKGEIELACEGAHSRRRILHASGDATGAEIIRTLLKVVRKDDNIQNKDNQFAVDIVTENKSCRGLLVYDDDERKFVFYRSPIVVIATGGASQIYRYTTNPEVTTGDGVAMAYRAGATLANMEFCQFHPTVLSYPGAPRFLISEAVRGEGAVLRNIHGERFMLDKHELAELAPRDVVARSIVEEMDKTKAIYVFLDITHEPSEELQKRFPTIYQKCLQYGLDISSDWIPVAPAAHYTMGGIVTDQWGQTEIKGLYACGEVACTQVHGANRLASNSLLEALVYGKRIADHISLHVDIASIVQDIAEYQLPQLFNKPISKLQYISERRLRLQKIMLRYVGLRRDQEGLDIALEEVGRFTPMAGYAYLQTSEFEFMNMLTCATLTMMAAQKRHESRGAHFRLDYPQLEDNWQKTVTLHIERGVEIVDDIRGDSKISIK